MGPCPWSAFDPATISFCEARLCAWIVEPSNAWSNLGYVVVGAIVLCRSRRRVTQILIGLASILIGFGSFGLHGTGTRWGELLDVGAMYLMSALGVLYAARRIWRLSGATLIAGYVALVSGSIGLMMTLHNNGILVFAVQIAIAVFSELYLYYGRGDRAPSYRPQQLMIGSFALAFLIWNLDKWNVLCAPDNHLVTGHALWHLLTALAIYFFARQQGQLPD
jgi:hypothetical protein